MNQAGFCPELKLLIAMLRLKCERLNANQTEINTCTRFAAVTGIANAAAITELSEILGHPINWAFFYELVLRHKLTPVTFPLLSHPQIKKQIPADILAQFQAHCRTNSCYLLNMMAEVKNLTNVFSEAGIPSLMLKGLALSQQLHGQFVMREPRDIDLLIPAKQLSSTHALLLRRGYYCCVPMTKPLSPKQFDFYQHQKKSFVYFHKHSGQQLELHWRLFDDSKLFPYDLEKKLLSLDQVVVAGVTIATLEREDNLIYLLLHGSHHAWSQLSWLCDIAYLINQTPPFDWSNLMLRAKALNIMIPVLEGLLLANELLNLTLPQDFQTICEQYPAVKSCAHLSLRIMRHPVYMSKWARITMFLREIKINYALGDYFHPFKSFFDIVAADWGVIRLPDKLFFLYYFLRPGLWVWRKLLKCYYRKLNRV